MNIAHKITAMLSTIRLDDGTIVPSGWYKLLIWCESGQLQAEYVWTLHENKDAKNVSFHMHFNSTHAQHIHKEGNKYTGTQNAACSNAKIAWASE